MSSSEQEKADELAAAIAALADIFVARIPAALDSMQEELDCLSQNAQNHASWKNLHRHLHNLAGSAGTFGHPELGDRARALEHRIDALLKTGDAAANPASSAFMQDQRNFMLWIDAQYVNK